MIPPGARGEAPQRHAAEGQPRHPLRSPPVDTAELRLRAARGPHRPGAGRAARLGAPAGRPRRPGVEHRHVHDLRRSARARGPGGREPHPGAAGPAAPGQGDRGSGRGAAARGAAGCWARAAGRRWCVPAAGSRRARCCVNPVTPDLLRVEVGETLGDDGRPVGRAVAPTSRVELADGIEAAGEIPLPPYIHTALADPDRYQTVYAERDRAESVGRPDRRAAPHARPCCASSPLAGVEVRRARRAGGRAGHVPAHHRRPGRGPPHARRALPGARGHPRRLPSRPKRRAGGWSPSAPPRCGRWRARRPTGELEGRTDLFIRPGFEFQVVDRLHDQLPPAPLVAAGDDRRLRRARTRTARRRWRDLYHEALAGDYRFLSFGDAMLLTRHDRRDRS